MIIMSNKYTLYGNINLSHKYLKAQKYIYKGILDDLPQVPELWVIQFYQISKNLNVRVKTNQNHHGINIYILPSCRNFLFIWLEDLVRHPYRTRSVYLGKRLEILI